MGDSNEDLRRSTLEKRRALTLVEVSEKSRAILERLQKFCAGKWGAETWKDTTIGLYRVAYDNPLREVDPVSLSENSPFDGAALAYPRIRSLADGTLDFVSTVHESDWRQGPFGLWEPRPELPALAPKALSLVICPGVVFDPEGGRIGMGKGFYDRFLARAAGAYRIGLAYDFQVVDEALSLQWYDQKMDTVVTESRVLVRS